MTALIRYWDWISHLLCHRQRNDMIRTNWRVFQHDDTLKGLDLKYEVKSTCVVEFFDV